MATAMAVPPLAPRPSPRPIAAWTPPKHHMEGKENRPALKQLQQTAQPNRPRRERPCDGCRRRKSKCVLQESKKCVLCEFHKQDCTFVENAQPRKRKADDGMKSDSPAKKSPAVTQRPLPPAPTPPRPKTESAPLVGVVQPSMRKPFAVDETLSLQRHRHCKYLGQTTALDASLIGLGNFNDKNETESRVGTLRQVTGSEYFSTHADADVQIPDDEARALAEIEQVVGPHGSALIDIYFRNVHPSYPIIQKRAFLDRHQHGDRRFNPPLLAAMYLLALAWWDQDPAVSSHSKPDVEKLEYIAITSLTISMQRPKISAVQAGLLLLQRPKSSTWTLTVQLVALGQDIGLHLDCSDWSIPRWETLLRKRLAWALYMQDKWSAVMHGRPSHINGADWNVSAPTEEDFDESIDPLPTPSEDVDPQVSKGRIVFMQMISLTNIMAEVCDTFYSEKAKAEYTSAGRYATQLVLNRAKPVQLKLKEWFAKLPTDCKMDSFTPGQLSSQGYLHLAYFATEISIHRRIVQSLDPATSDPYMLYICRSAAKTRLISALDFVNRLKPEHLDAFWYFASASNFALVGTFGALLMATSPGKEEAYFYACRLNEFKWTLTVSGKKAVWIHGALEMLDATSEMLRRLPEKPSATPTSELHLREFLGSGS
ncbi:hypothetical protein M409DRAFT_67978 [Zasmidium cellare ATCC 36951]|uniref:Zn(2)-C6 fungal-type domain-containing protein n=1 Tax=Zasmidium cellare ATCC 36951 TaxID=1080233 RepID=A0A6A6CCL5_ZASCE|nr:uncharacterized protein M409DRAFT_67978 [Zasmidium cellare ATCC 36951]KAF2164493.1 hypothetical protein M409DRAFT_67978 [Zasmidium cellare ATCC 36951]